MEGKEQKEKNSKEIKNRSSDKGEKLAGEADISTYFCISCEKQFEVSAGEKPRCPVCLSIHSIEPFRGQGRKTNKFNIRLALILAVLVASSAIAFAIMHFKYSSKTGGSDHGYIYSHQELFESLKGKGILKENLLDPFEYGGIKNFAETVLRNVGGRQKVEKLFSSFMDMKSKGGFIPFIPRQPRSIEPMSAGKVFTLMKKNEKVPLYSLELSTLFTVAARLAGLNALVVKVNDYADVKFPLDPSGNVGHFASAIYKNGNFKGNPESIVDLHQGKIFPVNIADFVPLTDLQVVACFYGLMAYYLSGVKFDSVSALGKIEDAIALYPSSPEFYSLRGLIYLSSGGIEEGKQQMRKAAAIRKDAQRLLKLGEIMMLEGDTEKAAQQIKQAIDLKPDYAMAHGTLAMALLAEGENDEAKKELEEAKRLDPIDPIIAVFEANYFLERGQIDVAIEKAQVAYEKSNGDPQIGILLASLYKQSGEKKKLNALLDRMMGNSNLPDEIKKNIQEKFNYRTSSIEEEEEEEEEFSLRQESLGKGLGKGRGLLSGEKEEEKEDEGNASLKLRLGTQQGGYLTGKGSGFDLRLK